MRIYLGDDLKAKIIDDNEEEIDEIELDEKEFSTGSTGYHGFGKVYMDGERFQANFMLVKIGSKEEKE